MLIEADPCGQRESTGTCARTSAPVPVVQTEAELIDPALPEFQIASPAVFQPGDLWLGAAGRLGSRPTSPRASGVTRPAKHDSRVRLRFDRGESIGPDPLPRIQATARPIRSWPRSKKSGACSTPVQRHSGSPLISLRVIERSPQPADTASANRLRPWICKPAAGRYNPPSQRRGLDVLHEVCIRVAFVGWITDRG